MSRQRRIKPDWNWCELLSVTQHYYIYKLPISKRVIKVDKITGIGYEPKEDFYGSWFTFKQQEYGPIMRATAKVSVPDKQRRLF